LICACLAGQADVGGAAILAAKREGSTGRGRIGNSQRQAGIHPMYAEEIHLIGFFGMDCGDAQVFEAIGAYTSMNDPTAWRSQIELSSSRGRD
jgi:hypothetical protein